MRRPPPPSPNMWSRAPLSPPTAIAARAHAAFPARRFSGAPHFRRAHPPFTRATTEFPLIPQALATRPFIRFWPDFGAARWRPGCRIVRPGWGDDLAPQGLCRGAGLGRIEAHRRAKGAGCSVPLTKGPGSALITIMLYLSRGRGVS